jgi:hypothetical protein
MQTTAVKSPRIGAVRVPPESSMIATVFSGTPPVSISITLSTSEM